MPAVKTPGVAAAIKDHVAGKRKAVSKYVMKSQTEGTEAEFTLIILKKEIRVGRRERLASRVRHQRSTRR